MKTSWLKEYLPSAVVIVAVIGGMFFVNHEMTAFKKDILADNLVMLGAHDDSSKSHDDLRDAIKVLLDAGEKDRDMIINEIRKLKE